MLASKDEALFVRAFGQQARTAEPSQRLGTRSTSEDDSQSMVSCISMHPGRCFGRWLAFRRESEHDSKRLGINLALLMRRSTTMAPHGTHKGPWFARVVGKYVSPRSLTVHRAATQASFSVWFSNVSETYSCSRGGQLFAATPHVKHPAGISSGLPHVWRNSQIAPAGQPRVASQKCQAFRRPPLAAGERASDGGPAGWKPKFPPGCLVLLDGTSPVFSGQPSCFSL